MTINLTPRKCLGYRSPVEAFRSLARTSKSDFLDPLPFAVESTLSWMRFLGFDLGGPTPDENTIRHFRNRLTETGTLKRVMKAFDWQLQSEQSNAIGPRETANGYIPIAGQIVDASLVPAPKQRNTDGEREAIKAGRSAKEIWLDQPSKATQKDVNARWTLKIGGKCATNRTARLSR